jgi:hypothetical protein
MDTDLESQLNKAKQLISRREYGQARAILIHLDHPDAEIMLADIDEILTIGHKIKKHKKSWREKFRENPSGFTFNIFYLLSLWAFPFLISTVALKYWQVDNLHCKYGLDFGMAIFVLMLISLNYAPIVTNITNFFLGMGLVFSKKFRTIFVVLFVILCLNSFAAWSHLPSACTWN